MEYFYISIGGIFMYVVIHILVRVPGMVLGSKFRRLGVMTGKSKQRIIAAVGSPTSVSSLPNGGQLLQWQATGYHIAIRFDANGIFDGITHEFAAN